MEGGKKKRERGRNEREKGKGRNERERGEKVLPFVGPMLELGT